MAGKWIVNNLLVDQIFIIQPIHPRSVHDGRAGMPIKGSFDGLLKTFTKFHKLMLNFSG
jgi:hypothetical protein